MLEIHRIRENQESVVAGLKKRYFEGAAETVARLLEIDKQRRSVINEVENQRNEMNTVSKSIGLLIREGKKDEANEAKAKTGAIKEAMKANDDLLNSLEVEQKEILLSLPNVPHESVPAGRGEDENVEIFRSDRPAEPVENGKPHWEICEDHNLISWTLGAKITGSGFPVYRGKGARLLHGLIQFFLAEATRAGYEEIYPPFMVNENSGYGTGQLPDKEGQMYHVTEDNLYLIPTAEVPVTNLYRDVILNNDELPRKNCAFSPCFRREAGSYGKEVKGLNRLHQFDKVELVQIAHPDQSYTTLDKMVDHVKGLLEKLELPYRILLLCGGDTGFTSAKTLDFEVFSAGQSRWLEVSSVSNFETFQANRLKLRFKEEGAKKTRLVHTLNGSALALPRIMAALYENNYQPDGSILMPEVLHPFLGFEKIG